MRALCVYVRVCVCGYMHVSVHVCAGTWVVGLHGTTCLLFSVKTLDHEVQDTRFSTLGDKTSATNKATHASQ